MNECRHCEHYAEPSKEIPKVHCKRFPPVPVAMIVYNMLTKSMDSMINMTPAAPYPQGCCGEFKAKLSLQ